MKKLMLSSVGAGLLFVAGCNTTVATITSPNGQIQKISNTRSAWSSESYSWSFSTNGTWSAQASKSGPDAATVAAFSQLLQTAMMAKP